MQRANPCRSPTKMKTGEDGMEKVLSQNPMSGAFVRRGLTLRRGMCDGRVNISKHLASPGL